MKKPVENAITGQYVVTSMSIDWDDEGQHADPRIFTTMSIEYTREPVLSDSTADEPGTVAGDL
jgi:hypothetical protein